MKFKPQCEKFRPGSGPRLRPIPKEIEPKSYVGICRKHSTESPIMDHQIDTYSALLRQIHNDLRVQHPDWIQPNGDSPLCDSYEARLMKLLDVSIGTRANETTAVPGC